MYFSIPERDSNTNVDIYFSIPERDSNTNVDILYVIQLSDRVYNVTFPAYDLYSLRRSRREYRS